MPTTPSPPSLGRVLIAEAWGTFLLVLFGCGVVHTAVLLDSQQGLWQVAVVWGIAIMLAIYSVGGVSGAHLNPAMTIAFGVWRDFPKGRVLPYIAAQLTGAFLAAAVLFTLFEPYLAAKEQAKGVERGKPGSELTAMCYGEFAPNPGGLAAGSPPYSPEEHARLRNQFPWWRASLAELIGTAVLAAVVFAVTDDRNAGAPAAGMAPIFIGLTVAALISVLAPLTQACFNPARDFGPRLFSALAGWGAVALPGVDGSNWLIVYIASPILGALLGATFYQFAVATPSRVPERP